MKIKIAIQNKGRLSGSSLDFLSSLGITFNGDGRSLITRCEKDEYELLRLRDDDIPEYVNRGVADFGIVGQNVLYEKRKKADIIKELGFGRCRLCIAVPENSRLKTVKDLEGERIATSYPHLLSEFLKENGVNAAIITLSGSVEIAPALNLADAICDLVQSGSTLKANNLKEFAEIMSSQAVLIESPQQKELKSNFINLLPNKKHND